MLATIKNYIVYTLFIDPKTMYIKSFIFLFIVSQKIIILVGFKIVINLDSKPQ